MIRSNWLALAGVTLMAAGLALASTSCTKKPTGPSGFQAADAIVDIPPCLTTSSRGAAKAEVDSLDGSALYDMECTYIAIADAEGDLVRGLLSTLQNFTGEFDGSWTSNGDHRVKHLVITQSSTTYEGQTFASRLELMDGTNNAFEMYYDTGASVRGVIIMAPAWLNRSDTSRVNDDTRVRIRYNRADAQYGKTIVVEGSGFPLDHEGAVGSLMMRAWVIGDTFRMQGNSDHPNARLWGDERTRADYNYAFMAHAIMHHDSTADSACMKVGVVPSTVTSTDSLVDRYSVDRALTTYINVFFPGMMPDTVAAYTDQAKNPGWYTRAHVTDQPGYIGNGPGYPAGFEYLDEWSGMTAYSPADVHALRIQFGGSAF